MDRGDITTSMDRELIKALLNKAVTAGSWELKQDGHGMSNITIRLQITDIDLQQLDHNNGKKLEQLFNNNGARRFKFHD